MERVVLSLTSLTYTSPEFGSSTRRHGTRGIIMVNGQSSFDSDSSHGHRHLLPAQDKISVVRPY